MLTTKLTVLASALRSKYDKTRAFISNITPFNNAINRLPHGRSSIYFQLKKEKIGLWSYYRPIFSFQPRQGNMFLFLIRALFENLMA
jgi:hypothetical protein